jgi:beta-galactosidase GanA
MGMNAIQTYVPWNFHQALPGAAPDFTGWRNLTHFLDLAQELDLLVLLRPGPYICAEWDFGGLPWWLLSPEVEVGRPISIRTDDPAYLQHVDAWWSALFDHIKRCGALAGDRHV